MGYSIMSEDITQYKDLFLETAKKYLATLNDELLVLEKTPGSEEAVASIFRAAHSLKGQSAAMGYDQIGYLCHVIEDIFYAIKEKTRELDSKLADLIFRALDSLTASVESIENGGNEIPADDIIDKLKKETGLKTEGSGKTTRSYASGSSEHAPEVVTETPAEKTTDEQPNPEVIQPIISISTIPVKVEQLDDIVGSIEELMVYRLTMQTLLKDGDIDALAQAQYKINKLIELIQFQVMKIRTVPLNMVFDHFPRAMRDLGRSLNKEIDFRVEGGQLELDRVIVERLDEPLIHLLRNAADHGIGSSGSITLSAHADRDFAVVSITDNGNGIDWSAIAKKANVDPDDKKALKKALFSGVSTASEVSLISGRGVGLEVVKKTIEEFGGTIDVLSTAGKGTTFTIKLPLAVSVIRTLIVLVDKDYYAIAATVVDASIKISNSEVIKSAGQEAFRYQDQEIPLIRLRSIFKHPESTNKGDIYVVIVNIDDERLGLVVDKISETLETVIKPLPQLLKAVNVFSGVTIVGDGRSVLLINPRGLNK